MPTPTTVDSKKSNKETDKAENLGFAFLLIKNFST